MRKVKTVVVVAILVGVSLGSTNVTQAVVPSAEILELRNPYWRAEWIDAAGYSDKFYWGPSPRHDVSGEHEMLSGEWGAAIYYTGISTEPKAMWLTNEFVLPDWYTNSDFQIMDSPNQWDNPANPVVGYDTGHSSIRNAQVEIDIDYEMVDLGQQGTSGQGGSPMTFGDFLVKSERYIMLQTYTITNITANPSNNLEFYQMLHGHPGNEYAAKVNSVYSTTYRDDPLENYTPFNPVHTVGNFRYEITQWNNLEGSATGVSHRDWIGFGSTIEPTWIENGTYAGHYEGVYKPPVGTHLNIEAGTLNEELRSYGEVAGAMGWFLGALQPGQSVSLTLAVMFGSASTCHVPVAQWKFDEGTGNKAYDTIGGNDGRGIGNPSWVAGHSGQAGDYALQFSGNNYVSLTNAVNALAGQTVTISAWVKPAAGFVPGSYYPIVTQYAGGQGYYLSVNGSYYPDFFLNSNCFVTSPDPIDTNWHYLVGTYDGQYIKLYVDGFLKSSVYAPGYTGVDASRYIGYGDLQYFKGVIDEVRIYNCVWECLPLCHPDYDDWLAMGKPQCWCTPYQCDGDADCRHSGGLTRYRVFTGDLSLIVENWQKRLGDPTLNPCADVDHRDSGGLTRFRVFTGDLSIVVANWQKRDADLPGDCASCERGQRSLAAGLDLTAMVEWLDQLWRDKEVRKAIDKDKWLSFVESLKGLIEEETQDARSGQ